MNKIELHTIATFQGKEYELEDLLNGLLNNLKEKDKEIERLKQKLETEHKAFMGTVQELTETATEKEKLNNAINELEKELKRNMEVHLVGRGSAKTFRFVENIVKKHYLDKLKELKGSGR